jgi:accessory gene regulator protein AgrB
VLFLLLRSFSGGYHAPTAGICFVCSVGLLFLAAMVLPDLKLNTMSHILFVLSTGIVLWLSPVEAINKPLDEKEHCVYRRISILLALIYAACYVLSAWLHIPVLQNAVWFAMCIQAIMLMFGRLLLFLTAKQNPA